MTVKVRRFRKPLIVSLAMVGIVILVGLMSMLYVVSRGMPRVNQDKDSALKTSMAIIKNSLGKLSITAVDSNGCTNSDQVWGFGKESCTVGLYVNIRVQSLDNANAYVKEFSETIDSSPDFEISHAVYALPQTGLSELSTQGSYVHGSTKSKCYAEFTFENADESLKADFYCQE